MKRIVIDSYTWAMLQRQAGDPASIDGGIEVEIYFEGDSFSYDYSALYLGNA
jgi:hypothetical protein